MARLLMGIWELKEQVRKDEVTLYAAQASFFLIISAFPLLMMTMNVIRFAFPDSMQGLSNLLTLLVPSAFHDSAIDIITEIYGQSTGTLLSVTAISSLWAASRGVMAVERGLNRVYSSSEELGYFSLRLICYFFTFFFIVSMLLVLVLLVFGNHIQLFLERFIPTIREFSMLVVGLRTFATFFIMTLFLMVMYRCFPGRKVKLMDQLPGALFATLGWTLFSFVYSLYITYFSSYPKTYGSLTAIVLIMLWLYFCMNITLLGAEINVCLERMSEPSL